MSLLEVLVLASPGSDASVLESSAVREGKSPRLLHLESVHLVEVKGGVFFTLATRKELIAFISTNISR